MPPEQIKIKNSEDLYYYYSLINQSQVDEASIEIALDDFIQKFDIETSYIDSLDRLKGHIDSDIATAVVKFQEFINLTYKIAKYQDQDINLSDAELNSIKIYVKVEEGSSTLKYAKAISKIFNEVTNGMTATQKIIFATLIVGVVTVGVVANNVSQKYIEGETRVELSQEETARQSSIIDGFTKMNSEINSNSLYKTIDIEGKKAILDPIKKSNNVMYKVTEKTEGEDDKISILDQVKVKKILKTKRNSAESDILRSHFKINGILNSSEQGKVKVQISTSDNALNGTVEFKKDDEDIDFTKILSNFGAEDAIELIVRTKTLKGKTTIDRIVATVGGLDITEND